MLRYSDFSNSKSSQPQFFHLNFEFECTGFFKALDWQFLLRQTAQTANRSQTRVQGLVMMDTHIHLLIRQSDQRENFFAEEISQRISPQTASAPFIEPLLHHSQYLNTYKYIYRNPIEAGLSTRVETYAFSSIQILLGRCESPLFIDDPLGFIQAPFARLAWLNSEGQLFKTHPLRESLHDSSFLK